MATNTYLLGRPELRTGLQDKEITLTMVHQPQTGASIDHDTLIWMVKNTPLKGPNRKVKEDLFDKKTIIKLPRCETCGSPVYHSRAVHVNICQTPSKRYFCSYKCKQETTRIKEV